MKSRKEQYRRGESRVSPEGSNPQRTEESSPERSGERRTSGQEYDGRVVDHAGRPVSEDADVTLDIPSLEVEELNLDVENLRHRTSMQAELADMVKLNIGVETILDGAKLEAKGIDAQTFLKAKLDNVRAILSQTLDTIDNNPQILQDIARIAEETAGTGERALEGPAGRIGETIEGPGGRIGETPDQEPEDRDTGEPDATSAARRKAEDLGIDLSQVEGTGSGGRILVRDVTEAAK